MKKLILSVALMGYALSASPLTQLALNNNYDIKTLQEQTEALKQEVDLSTIWENPKLTLGAKDIYFDEPLTRNQGAQNESLEFSQKIPTGSKLDIKESIAVQNLAMKRLELKDKKLSLIKDVSTLEALLGRIEADLNSVTKYETLLDNLKEAHLAYNATTSAHYSQTLSNTILEKSLLITKKTLLREKQSALHKLESLINTKVSEPLHVSTNLLPYHFSNETSKLFENNPKLQIQKLLSLRELNNLRYEKAQKIPDVTVGIGYNRRQSRDDFWFLSFSIPLPIYGRENLSIRKAELSQNASEQSVNSLSNTLTYELQDELLNKELQSEKIALTRDILEENQRIYDNLSATAFAQNDVVLKLLSNLTQSLDTEIKINTLSYLYNQSIIKITYLLGEEL